MPGILPMKMIRVGSNSQSRIAQACDRCRSKKIRCDGIRPCCSQCSNVGFECKTSDKLSRRAFPRGYTESLEDRVRALEAEVRDLKDLLDEKDEKIDMLSRIHNFSPMPRRSSSTPNSLPQVKAEEEALREDTILVEIPVAVQPTNSSIGTSTTAALIEAFEETVHSESRTCPPISSTKLLKPSHIAGKVSPNNNHSSPAASTPPRLLSDQYINLFFQEWQPLLPILHRPTFLKLYEEYLADPEARSWQNNKHAIAQLFLIFEISAHSASSRTRPVTTGYEMQWRKALSATSSAPTIATIQSHLLAQLCYLLKADYPHLLRHRGYAVSMVHQLYLHQGHRCHSLPVFDAETRKKVFWCQYVLDKFASAATGTPQLLRDSDITADYPLDIDDENISAHGISPALPGELTKISSALALFQCSRILGKTMDNLYPAKASYQLSLTKLHSLSDELDQWQEELPDHLRLRFCNDKPATNLISCRSPLLSLAYFYVRSLIHRPLLCYGSGNAASAATIVLATAAKHKLQIIDLLDERSMNYTFPLSKQDVLMNAGISILWQSLGLDEESRLVKDNQKSLTLMLGKMSKENQSVSSEFLKIATSFITLPMSRPSTARNDTEVTTSQVSRPISAPNNDKQKSARKQLQAIASRLSSFNSKPRNEEITRSVSLSQPIYNQTRSPNPRAGSTISLLSTKSAPAMPTPPLSRANVSPRMNNSSTINLDYFPLDSDTFETNNNTSVTMLPPKKTASVTHSQPNWEQLANDFDLHSPDMFTTVSPTVLNASIPSSGAQTDWSHELWQIAGFDLAPRGNVPQSLLSFSEESLTSAEDLVFSAPSSRNGSTTANETCDLISSNTTGKEPYRGIAIPVDDEFDF